LRKISANGSTPFNATKRLSTSAVHAQKKGVENHRQEAGKRAAKWEFFGMTLTPPRIGDLAARSPTQRRLEKKSPDESNAAR
jgi:hypothetical protein